MKTPCLNHGIYTVLMASEYELPQAPAIQRWVSQMTAPPSSLPSLHDHTWQRWVSGLYEGVSQPHYPFGVAC